MSSVFRSGRSKNLQDFSQGPGKRKTFGPQGIAKERDVLEARYKRARGDEAEGLFMDDSHAGVGIMVDGDGGGGDDEEDSLVADVVDGRAALDISHGGLELGLLLQYALQGNPKQDRRNRRNRVELRSQAFAEHLDPMVDAYLRWQTHTMKGAEPSPPVYPQILRPKTFTVFDLFRTYTFIGPAAETVPPLVGQGFIPSAPKRPSFLVPIRVLQLYHSLQLRCPHLSIQPFVKSLCDLQGVEYRSSICEQFTICYDVFIAVQDGARSRALKAVGRDHPDWRLKNACPCCCNKLTGEKALTFEMLITMDGNNSLKRILRRDPDGGVRAAAVERVDRRVVGGDYYIPREDVDRWEKGKREKGGKAHKGEKDGGGDQGKAGGAAEEDSNASACSERWKNLSESITSKMWSVFDETGVFTSLCRHGFILVLVDMLRSGELSKYPLAVVEKLLKVFGERLGVGYDIGCGFLITLLQSLLGDLATDLSYRSLVGAFHGHAHNRLCQVDNLATYVKGLGLEDLEGAERFFSKSNALASSTRYASRFHRQQKIVQFIKGNDSLEVYPNLSKFLVNNYKQALDILAGETEFVNAYHLHGINDVTVFNKWLVEEKQYLTSLKKEPEEETLQMAYLEKLTKLYEYDDKLNTGQDNWIQMSAPQSYRQSTSETTRRERQQRQTAELRFKTLECVHDLENQLLIAPALRWLPGSTVWVKTEELVRKRDYQLCLDQLESLVVARLFEFGKVNLPHTGYKLRQHISKAIKSRSQAVRTALDKYNVAASKLKPPGRKLDWDEVSEYTFLSEFDLLRDTRKDVRDRDWAKPAARRLMDQFFKLERAREEIDRLNTEIARLVTHIADEERYLSVAAAVMKGTNPALAHEIELYAQERSRSNKTHLQRLDKLSKMKGFTGMLDVGLSQCGLSPWLRAPTAQEVPAKPAAPVLQDDGGDESDDSGGNGSGIDGGAEGDDEGDESDDEGDESDDEADGLGWLTDKLLELTTGGDSDEEEPEEQ